MLLVLLEELLLLIILLFVLVVLFLFDCFFFVGVDFTVLVTTGLFDFLTLFIPDAFVCCIAVLAIPVVITLLAIGFTVSFGTAGVIFTPNDILPTLRSFSTLFVDKLNVSTFGIEEVAVPTVTSVGSLVLTNCGAGFSNVTTPVNIVGMVSITGVRNCGILYLVFLSLSKTFTRSFLLNPGTVNTGFGLGLLL